MVDFASDIISILANYALCLRAGACYVSVWANMVSVVKSMLINKAVQDIGMGTYNWQLFVLCGFGWFADKYGSIPMCLMSIPY